MQGKVFIAHKFCSKWNIDITCMRFEILSSQGLLTKKKLYTIYYELGISCWYCFYPFMILVVFYIMKIVLQNFMILCTWLCFFFIVEDEIFQLNVSFILIYGCFFVQIIIYVTFIRNREFVFQIFTFLCLHELYMAYAWSKWSRLKLFPLNKSYI